VLDLAVEFRTKGFDGGGMGTKKVLAIRKNNAEETDAAMGTLPFDGANSENQGWRKTTLENAAVDVFETVVRTKTTAMEIVRRQQRTNGTRSGCGCSHCFDWEMTGKKRKKKEKRAKVEKKMKKWTLNMFTDKQRKQHKNESKWWRVNR
jgi:hypothetical protein